MTENVHIRKADPSDAVLIATLSSETFFETFAEQNTKEDMDKYLSEKFDLPVIVSELEDKHAVFFIAYYNNEAAGYTKLRDNKLPKGLQANKALEIERIYVYKKFHGKKIGAELMEHNIAYAVKNGFDAIWLGVWEYNPQAIRFYEKFGFKKFGEHIFRLGNDDQTDHLMKKEL